MKKLFSTRYSDNSLQLSLLLLRLALGGLMLPNGWYKLVQFNSLAEGFADPFHLGPAVSLALVVFAEFFCAALLVLGFMTRLATIPLLVTMSVALFKAHKGDLFGEGEMAALYLGGYLALLLTGPGKLSVDRLIGK
jgi:putative oxidoreductase